MCLFGGTGGYVALTGVPVSPPQTIASLKELCSTLDNQLTDMEELLKKQEGDSQKHQENKLVIGSFTLELSAS